MGWLSKTSWVNTDKPTATDLNNIGADIRTWGGAVNAGGYTLSALGQAQLYNPGFTVVPRLGNLIPGSFSRLDLTYNSGSYSAGNFNRDNTGDAAAHLVLNGSGILMSTAPAGANPITTWKTASMDTGGNWSFPANVAMVALPTSAAGLTSGQIWRDSANGNVLKMVP